MPSPAARPAPGLPSRTAKRLAPGMPGTKRFLERYGPALVCVRYRIEPETGRRLTTIELIVEEKAPKAPTACWVRIAYDETKLRARAKAAGAQWDASRKLWQLTARAVKALGLENRVVANSQ